MVRRRFSAVSNHEAPCRLILRDARKRAPQHEGESGMTFDDVRKIALAWPEVEDSTSYGTPSLKVRKKMLVRLKEDGDSLAAKVADLGEKDFLLESAPEIFFT